MGADEDGFGGLTLEERQSRVVWQRGVGGVVLFLAGAQCVLLIGLVAKQHWADSIMTALLGGRSEVGLFRAIMVIAVVAHLGFVALAGLWPAQRVSRVLGLAWGIGVSELIVCSALMGWAKLGGTQSALRPWILLGLFVTPVALACFMAVGRSEGRGLLKRQAWLLMVLALFFALQCVASVFQLSQNSSRGVMSSEVVGRAIRATPTVMLLVSLLVLWFGRGRYWRMRMEMERGIFCLGCRYDMTGTFAAGGRVCPECGREAGVEQVWRAEGVEV
jgi:hypothetical protein